MVCIMCNKHSFKLSMHLASYAPPWEQNFVLKPLLMPRPSHWGNVWTLIGALVLALRHMHNYSVDWLTQTRAHRSFGHGYVLSVLPTTPFTRHVRKLITSGRTSTNVNWTNSFDRDRRLSGSSRPPRSYWLVRLNILPVMLIKDTLLNTAPPQMHNAINIKATSFMLWRKDDGWFVSSALFDRDTSARDVWDWVSSSMNGVVISCWLSLIGAAAAWCRCLGFAPSMVLCSLSTRATPPGKKCESGNPCY